MATISISITAMAAAGWLLVGTLAAADATQMRRCEAADGAVAYQTAPCADGESETWRRPLQAPLAAAADASGATAPAGHAADRRRPASRPPAARRRGAPSPAARAADAARARCERARRDADQARDTGWNRLDFRARSALDAEVARACRR
jgi:hypothetical protein